MPNTHKSRVAFVDDEQDLTPTLKVLFEADYEVAFFTSSQEALSRIDSSFAVVVSDQRMPGMTGDRLLARLCEKTPDTMRILLTAVQDRDLLDIFPRLINEGHIFRFVAKNKQGLDYLEEVLRDAVDVYTSRQERKRKQLEAKQLRSHLRLEKGEEHYFEDLIGQAPQLLEAIDIGRDAAKNIKRALIFGESGTGKEIMARAIHFEGPTCTKPFVALNCSYYKDPDRFRSELMGHTKDAYPGAGQASTGLLRDADGGTIFLDEIGELSLDMQATLLRFLESGDIQPLGSTSATNLKVNVRIIAATNRDLQEEARQGNFREDVFYRLAKHEIIRLPPLRERPDDIELLVRHQLVRLAAEHNRQEISVSQAALDMLRQLRFPGNVRELNSTLSRAVGRMRRLGHDTLDADAFEKNIHAQTSTSTTLRDTQTNLRKKQVEEAVKRHGTLEAAAEELGMTTRNLHLLRKKFNLR